MLCVSIENPNIISFMQIKILKELGMIVIVLVAFLAGGLYWVETEENRCWQNNASQIIKDYQDLKTREAILHKATSLGLDISYTNSNSFEIGMDYNGCSLGSNGRSIAWFYFNNSEKLKTIQVFRDYVGADYTKEIIHEKQF